MSFELAGSNIHYSGAVHVQYVWISILSGKTEKHELGEIQLSIVCQFTQQLLAKLLSRRKSTDRINTLEMICVQSSARNSNKDFSTHESQQQRNNFSPGRAREITFCKVLLSLSTNITANVEIFYTLHKRVCKSIRKVTFGQRSWTGEKI